MKRKPRRKINLIVVQHRSARTGRFVTAAYAKRYPATTVKERMKRKRS